MKRWMLCLLCTLTLGLGFAGLASAEPAAPRPADQQFLASLAAPVPAGSPAPTSMACGPDFCTNAQRQACRDYCWETMVCWGALTCDSSTCLTHCICSPCYI